MQTTATIWRTHEAGGLVEAQQMLAERERLARTIRSFSTATVAGPAQTAEYARALFTLIDAADVEAGTAARLARQSVLLDTEHTVELLHTEGALRWRPGPPQVLLGQLAHLANLMALPNVRIGVVPFSIQAPTTYEGRIAVYEDFADASPALVEVESPAAEFTSIAPYMVDRFRRRLDRVAAAALYDDDARALLASIAEDLRSG